MKKETKLQTQISDNSNKVFSYQMKVKGMIAHPVRLNLLHTTLGLNPDMDRARIYIQPYKCQL